MISKWKKVIYIKNIDKLKQELKSIDKDVKTYTTKDHSWGTALMRVSIDNVGHGLHDKLRKSRQLKTVLDQNWMN